MQFCHGGGLAMLGTLSIPCFSFSVDMTTPAGGFLVTNYHDIGRKVSKSNWTEAENKRDHYVKQLLTLGLGDH